MTATIEGCNPTYEDEIVEAFKQEFGTCGEDPDVFSLLPTYMQITARGNLCGGESEEEFADRLAAAIWRANSCAYCKVEVRATFLEDVPYETHVRDREAFKRLKDEVYKTGDDDNG